MDENTPLIKEKGKEGLQTSAHTSSSAHTIESTRNINTGGLSLFFTILCIIDLFGVFPVVTLPKVVILCGVYGIPIVLFVFSLQIYTAILLGRCWILAEEINPNIVNKNRYPYAALAEMTFGPVLSNIVTVLLDATVFGGGIPNLLVASQNLQLFGLKMSEYQLDFSFCWWLIIIGILLCPVMWLGSPKDMKCLAAVSVLVVTSVMGITCFCMLTDIQGHYDGAPARPGLQEVLMAYGILAFQFDVHPMLLTIQVDMKDSSKIGIAVICGFLVTGSMFAFTSSVAAHRYGVNVESNLLQGLPASFSLYLVVLLVTLQLCLSSAVGNSALFQHIEDKLGISRDFSSKRCLIRAFIVAFGVFLGETVPRFDIVMGLIGSTLTGPLVFILPPLIYGKIVCLKYKLSLDLKIKIKDYDHTSEDSKSKTHDDKSKKIKKNMTLHFQGETECDGGLTPDMAVMYAQKKEHDINVISLEPFFFVSNTCRKLDLIVCALIMCFGIIATCTATYYSWADAIAYAQFTPPCLVNITAASLSLPV